MGEEKKRRYFLAACNVVVYALLYYFIFCFFFAFVCFSRYNKFFFAFLPRQEAAKKNYTHAAARNSLTEINKISNETEKYK